MFYIILFIFAVRRKACNTLTRKSVMLHYRAFKKKDKLFFETKMSVNFFTLIYKQDGGLITSSSDGFFFFFKTSNSKHQMFILWRLSSRSNIIEYKNVLFNFFFEIVDRDITLISYINTDFPVQYPGYLIICISEQSSRSVCVCT